MLAVKSQHTAAAARMIAPLLAPDASVLSLQNGLNGDAIAGEVGAERVLLALVDFASDYIEPGVIHYGGRGSVFVGEADGEITPRVHDYVAVLKSFDEAIEPSGNVLGLLWGKIAYGGLLTATALTNDTMADVLGDPRWRGVMGKIGREIVLAAKAGGGDAGRRRRLRCRSVRKRGYEEDRGELRCHGGALPPFRQDTQRHLARPRGAQTQDRGRPPALARDCGGREIRRRDAGDASGSPP